MKSIFTKPLHFIFILVSMSFLASCNYDMLKYVSDEGSGNVKNDFVNERSEKTIQPYDYLYIKIFSLDEKTNTLFNERGMSLPNELLSYSVDGAGHVNLPFVTNIYVKDLTINQAREKIEKSLSLYLNNISVVVRFVSNKVTVLGEVRFPGQHPFYDERISVFQALGLASGASDYGNLSNVTLVREKDNIIKYYKLDLTKKNIASSEFYYLLPNDILIINPINAKYRDLKDYAVNRAATVVSATAALFSILYISTQL